MASREEEFLSDLECGGTTSEEDNRGKKALTMGFSGTLDYNGSISGDSEADSSDSFSRSRDVSGGRVELLIERSSGGEECGDLVALLDKRNPRDQPKKSSLKKASKPPRPPNGPLLNAADLKLVKELSEFAARKRTRIERMKALRKTKEVKQTSSSSNLTAMVITIFFFLVMIFQGVFSRNNINGEFQGSPAPAVASEGLISIQLFNNAPTSEINGLVPMPFNSWEQAFSSSPREEEGRDTG